VLDIDPCFGSREDIILKGIEKLMDFFKGLGLPVTLKDLNIGKDKFEEMAEKAMQFGPIGKYVVLKKEDVRKIYDLSA
jgi:alcohol dehydrogenase YqhD (iron-dependent ADH family)